MLFDIRILRADVVGWCWGRECLSNILKKILWHPLDTQDKAEILVIKLKIKVTTYSVIISNNNQLINLSRKNIITNIN